MKIIAKLKKFLLKTIYGAYRLDSQYDIFYQNEKIASIRYDSFNDMFWHYYHLLPLTNDESKLQILYDGDFWWGPDIKIQGLESKACVDFLLAGLTECGKDSQGNKMELKERPMIILLRGPYLADKH